MSAPTANIPAIPPTPPASESIDVERVRTGRRTRVPAWLVILWRNNKCRVGIVLLAAFMAIAALAPLLAPYDPRADSFPVSQGPTGAHLLGTTAQGEDVLSQLIFSARTSLLVGLVAGLIATAIALVIGLTAGYLQGWVDEVLSFFINLGLVVPVLPLIVVLAAYAPVRGLGLIIIVISITGWAYGARIKRAQVITLRTRDYITAAKFAGDGTARIILREIVPNMTSLIVVGFMSAALGAIGAESGLSFLGLGDPQTLSWGAMLNQASVGGALLTGQWAWLVAPGLALSGLIISFTLINFGVDALSNPHLRED
jgi:peptide/nickel transport system permease protein